MTEDSGLMHKIVSQCFKEHKVEISDAIKALFPFLETLRDNGVITSEMYNESKKSFENLSPVQKVVYEILDKMEEDNHLIFLKILFSKVIMKNYPDLNDVYEDFNHAIKKAIGHQASGGKKSAKDLNTQLSFKQGTGAYAGLPWLLPDPPNSKEEINAMDTNTNSDNDTLQIQQANEQCAQEPEPAESPNLKKLPTPRKKVCRRGDLQGTFASAGRSHEGFSGANANKRLSGAVTPAVRSHEVSGSSGASAEKKPPGPRTPAVRSHEVSGSSGASAEKKPPGAGTPAVRSHEVPASSGASAEKKPLGAETLAVRSGANQQGLVDLGNSSTLQKVTRKRRTRQQPGAPVDFDAEILPVTCGETKGMLYKEKLEQGSMAKCIKTEDGKWFTPREFEVAGGYESSRNWKANVRCGGKSLKQLIEVQKVPAPPRQYGRKKKPDLCEVCEYGENLLCCDTCSRFFHGYCHFPSMETKRSPWSCTFCRIKESSGGQPCVSESEVLARWMGPEEQLKCEFLLLATCCHLKNNCSEKTQQGNQILETLQRRKTYMMLNEIGRKLSVQGYPKVEQFTRDMRLIFQYRRAFDKNKDLFSLGMRLEAEFEKNFKKVFAIQEVKQEHREITIKLENNA